MTATFDFDRLLESVLDAGGPQTASQAVVDAALTTTSEIPQSRPLIRSLDRRAWPAPRFGRERRVLILAVIATALVAIGVVGAGVMRDLSTPRTLVSRFVRPFEYVMPVDSGIRQSGWSLPEMVAWVQGPDVSPIASDGDPDGGTILYDQPQPGQVRGIVIGSGGEAWSHGPDGQFMLRTAPAEFLADLRDTVGTPMDAITETQLDGRPALTVMLPGTGGSDIHVTGRMRGLGGTFVLVNMPSRLLVADVDGITVFVLTWARTADDLKAWMPLADEFVESIHFVAD